MDFLTGIPLPAGLTLLALLDGLSVGTLLIPVFFLIAPGRPRTGRIMLYLGTITLFYLAVGVLFMLGLVNIVDAGRAFIGSPAGQTAMLAIGIVMLVAAFSIPGPKARQRKAEAAERERALQGSPPGSAPGALQGSPLGSAQESAQSPSGRIARWRDRLLADGTSGGAIMGVALAAGLVEVATMLPYLIGMTMIADAPITMPHRVALLAGYCLVMIAPALVLIAGRLLLARVIDAPLRRLAAWLERTGAENTAWVLGIIGFLLVRSGATQLGIPLPIIGSG
ncbi:GAP family protein [Leucobacter sp. gxy201]|uniref:GAP family protein n=1 Tax=Leucobacter sp. gxy201 TaxID=2957200 RepID=UPI003DA0C6B2